MLQVDDSHVSVVSEAMKTLEPKLNRSPGKMKLDFFSQTNFIGLFVLEEYYHYLTDIVSTLSSALKKDGNVFFFRFH